MDGPSGTLDTVVLDVGVPAPEAVIDACEDRLRRRSVAGGIPATRNLLITLYTVLASVGATVATGLLIGEGPAARAAFVVAASGLAIAAAIGRAVTTPDPCRPARAADLRAAAASGGRRSSLTTKKNPPQRCQPRMFALASTPVCTARLLCTDRTTSRRALESP